MADKDGGSGNEMPLLIGLVLLFGYLWWVNGGVHTNPASRGGTSTMGTTAGSQTISNKNTPKPPPRLTLSRGNAGQESFATREYLILNASGQSGSLINVTGYQLQGLFSYATIGLGYDLYQPSTGAAPTNIYFRSGDHAILTSGHSPFNASIRVNKCSGYLQNDYHLYPALNLNCPRPADWVDPVRLYQENQTCVNYIKQINYCGTINLAVLPDTLSSSCRQLLVSTVVPDLNYQGCVEHHKYDKDFFKNEWRIFLGSSASLWRDRNDSIGLYDRLGNLVSSLKY